MSPVPIIDLQRRLSLVGAIRCGEKSERGAPRRLDTFRITSPSRTLVGQAAGLYGGVPSEWQSPSGLEWQVTTTTTELPVLVMPGYSLRQTYELWEGATKRSRLCDGQEMSDGTPCLCEKEGVDKCDLYTRLVVALPELDTVLGWRLISKGVNAGHEIPTLMGLILSVADGKPFVPAKLRLVERSGVKDGQKVRYVVPTLDLGAGYTAIAAASAPSREISPPAYTPIEKQLAAPVAVSEALELTDAGRKVRTGRSAAPMSDVGDDFDAAPVPASHHPATTAPTDYLTSAQAKKLNVLVGKLRPERITTDQLWAAVAKGRGVTVDDLVGRIGGRDTAGVLHWALLRDCLSKTEASNLIERLSKLETEGAAE